jgi:hypothetical protein
MIMARFAAGKQSANGSSGARNVRCLALLHLLGPVRLRGAFFLDLGGGATRCFSARPEQARSSVQSGGEKQKIGRQKQTCRRRFCDIVGQSGCPLTMGHQQPARHTAHTDNHSSVNFYSLPRCSAQVTRFQPTLSLTKTFLVTTTLLPQTLTTGRGLRKFIRQSKVRLVVVFSTFNVRLKNVSRCGLAGEYCSLKRRRTRSRITGVQLARKLQCV